MSNSRANTNLQLPAQSKHGVIMKTFAFHDPDTQQVSWLIANKTLSGDWKILKFETDILGGENPQVKSVSYKSEKLLDYGSVITIFADYERVRKNSGMLELVNDYPVTKNISSYREVAHSDGIAFDVDGYPHLTVQGNIVTEGQFSLNEMMAVLEAANNSDTTPTGKMTGLSKTFADTQPDIGKLLQDQSEVKSLEKVIDFINNVLGTLSSIQSSTYISYESQLKVMGMKSIRKYVAYKNKDKKNFSITIYSGDEYGSDQQYDFSQDLFNKNFNEASKILKDSHLLSPELRKEGEEFLYGVGIILSSQIVHACLVDAKKTKLNGHSLEGSYDASPKRSDILKKERNTLIEHITRYGKKKTPKKQIESHVDQILANAIREDFPERIKEVQEIGEALIAKIQLAATIDKPKHDTVLQLQAAQSAPVPAKP